MTRPLLRLPYLMVVVLLASGLSADGPVTYPSVSEKASPVQVFHATAQDGHQTVGALRKPPGPGPFPAIVFLHGGLREVPLANLKAAIHGATQSRFLASGWVIVVPTYRSRDVDPQTRVSLEDCLAVADYVKKLPEVDPKSVVVWGGSGGGDLALQIAGETSLAAIVPEEPAVVLMMGMMTTKTPRKGEKYTPADATEMCEQPQRYYTPEIQAITRQKIAKINCPIFLPEGGASLINRINNEIFIPELVKAGKNIKVVVYPGQPHVFAMGNRDPLAALWCFNDAESFLSRYIGAKARPIDPSLVEILSLSTQ